MHGFRLISQYYGALDAILGHTPYLSGSYEVCLFVHTILIEMMSHVIFFDFIMFMLDVILGITPSQRVNLEFCGLCR